MIADSIEFRGHRCFRKGWAGFRSTKPINVIIGRNNTGKSHLLDLVCAICEGKLKGRGWRYRCAGVLDEQSLKHVFSPSASGGGLGGNFWEEHGRYFVGQTVLWETDENAEPLLVEFPSGWDYRSRQGEPSTKARLAHLKEVLKAFTHRISGSTFRRLVADRDIR